MKYYIQMKCNRLHRQKTTKYHPEKGTDNHLNVVPFEQFCKLLLGLSIINENRINDYDDD